MSINGHFITHWALTKHYLSSPKLDKGAQSQKPICTHFLHQDLIVSLRQLWHTGSLNVAPRSQHDIDSGSLTPLRALVEALYEI
tara:strand:+ start:93 stop:344 length:252 start_codon:yes stop_codon:yes gene_type:complete